MVVVRSDGIVDGWYICVGITLIERVGRLVVAYFEVERVVL